MNLLRKLAIFLFAVATSTAFAADAPYPSKEIRFIVPAPPGGATDVATRALARVLADDGYRLIVENVPGGLGQIGLGKVVSAAPDGYYLGMSSSTILALAGQGSAGSACQRQSQADGTGDAQDTYMCSEPGFLLSNAARSGTSLPGPIRGDLARLFGAGYGTSGETLRDGSPAG